jgi:hypothetical protein
MGEGREAVAMTDRGPSQAERYHHDHVDPHRRSGRVGRGRALCDVS